MQQTSLQYSRSLAELASRWLKRPTSNKGHACNVAIVEGCAQNEKADAIGFKHSGLYAGSVLVEVKVSRADFLNDFKKKDFRIHPEKGMGKWRYYLCPEGLIKPTEVPEKWGLLYVTKGNRIQVICGAMQDCDDFQQQDLLLKKYAFEQYNQANEILLLTKTITRFDDVKGMIDLQRINSKLSLDVENLKQEGRENSIKLNNAVYTSRKNFVDGLDLQYRLYTAGLDYHKLDQSDQQREIGQIKKHLEDLKFFESVRKRPADRDMEAYIKFIELYLSELLERFYTNAQQQFFQLTNIELDVKAIQHLLTRNSDNQLRYEIKISVDELLMGVPDDQKLDIQTRLLDGDWIRKTDDSYYIMAPRIKRILNFCTLD